MPRGRKSQVNQILDEVDSNQSKLSMILGALIVIVVGILIFNYFNKSIGDLGPAQQNQAEGEKYTVKEGDSLFLIAEKYYKDGKKFEELAKANNLSDVNDIEVGQVLDIPNLPEPQVTQENTTWGTKISEDTYTVTEGDWLSTIAARAYGDVYAYQKIADANGITNPDLIYPGQVLKIPR